MGKEFVDDAYLAGIEEVHCVKLQDAQRLDRRRIELLQRPELVHLFGVVLPHGPQLVLGQQEFLGQELWDPGVESRDVGVEEHHSSDVVGMCPCVDEGDDPAAQPPKRT